MTPEEAARQAAHKMLDLLSVMDLETQQLPPSAVPTVMRELNEIGAVRLLTHPLTGAPQAVDITGLIHGTYFVMRDLVADVVEATGRDALDVVANLRGRVDES